MARLDVVPRARTTRRTRARVHRELVGDLERLARLQPGGAPERPIAIASPAQVEIIATRGPCPLCEGTLQLREHAHERIDGEHLRVARLACTSCGTARAVWFRLEEPLQS